MIVLREPIRKYAEALEMKMREKDPIKGDSWKRMTIEQHREGFSDELDELCNARTEIDELGEYLDIGNRCWMLWYRLGGNRNDL